MPIWAIAGRRSVMRACFQLYEQWMEHFLYDELGGIAGESPQLD
ncbi:MAG: hypothetical protein R3B95_18340 [Nitrospirales bacterium]